MQINCACQEKEDEDEDNGEKKEQKRKETPTEALNGQVKSRVAAVESAGNKGSTVGSPEFSPARGSVASGGQSRHGGLKHSDSRWPSTSTQRDFPN